ALLSAVDELTRVVEVFGVLYGNKPRRNFASIYRESLGGRIRGGKTWRICISRCVDAVPGIEKILCDCRLVDDQTIICLCTKAGNSPIRAACKDLQRLASRVTYHHKFVVREMS